MKGFLILILAIVGILIGWGLFNYLLVSSAFILSGVEQQFPILKPLLGIVFIVLLLILLIVSYKKTLSRAKQVLIEPGIVKLVHVYLSLRWGQIFLVDLVIILTIIIILITSR